MKTVAYFDSNLRTFSAYVSCSDTFCKIYRRAPAIKSNFNNVTDLQTYANKTQSQVFLSEFW